MVVSHEWSFLRNRVAHLDGTHERESHIQRIADMKVPCQKLQFHFVALWNVVLQF